MMWSQTYEGANANASTSMVQTADGGYAFAGTKVEGTDQWSVRGYVWPVKTDEL